ncbi:MAG: aminopeptidase [Candidatus Bathyarchaeia archaeon]
MTDPYLEKLADILVDYSLGEVDLAQAWKNGQKRLMITYEPPADELAKLVTERVLDAGGNVFLDVVPSWYPYTFYTRASETVLKSKPEEALKRLDHVAARLSIRSETNTRSMATVDPKRIAMRSTAIKPYRDRAYEVDDKGDFLIPWCVTLFPTEAYAQDMGMSYSEYTDYVWKVMLLDRDNPMKAWQTVEEKQKELKKKVLEGSRTVRIVDKEDETDLKMSVEGHRWITSEGKRNFPSDEIFNAPRKDSVQGVITFPKLPQYYSARAGPEVSGIRIKFKNGKVVDWKAKVGQDYLDKFLEENPGATSLGEIALGLHPGIQRISKQILFDEKIGGTVHIAFGSAYRLHVLGDRDKSQLNESSVHWDMIRDMRKPSAYVLIDEKYKLTWNGATGRWVISSMHS